MTLTTSLCYNWIGCFSPEFILAEAAKSWSTMFVTIDGENVEETASQYLVDFLLTTTQTTALMCTFDHL